MNTVYKYFNNYELRQGPNVAYDSLIHKMASATLTIENNSRRRHCHLVYTALLVVAKLFHFLTVFLVSLLNVIIVCICLTALTHRPLYYHCHAKQMLPF